MNVSTSTDNAGFPSKERPNSQKDGKYVLSWLQAIYAKSRTYILAPTGTIGAMSDDNTGRSVNIWNMGPLAYRTRLETRGIMDVEEFKKVFSLSSPEANTILTGRAIKWTMPQDHVPYFDRLYQIFSNRDTKLMATVNDQSAKVKELDEAFEKLAKIVMADDPRVAQANAAMGVDMSPAPSEPQDVSEWETMQRIGSKSAMAMAIRKAISGWKKLVRYDRTVRPAIADALVDDNVTVVVLGQNNRGVPIPFCPKFENCMIPRTTDNWIDMPWFGVRMWMTPSQILAEMGKEATPEIRDRLQRLARRSSQMAVQSLTAAGRPMILDPNMTEDGIEVMWGWFKDYNILETATGRDGIKRIYDPETMDPSEHEITRTQYEVVYEGKWVINTSDPSDGEVDHSKDRGSISWGCRLSNSQVRDRGQLWKTRIPVAISAYRMTNMYCQSIGARMMKAYNTVVTASLELKALLLHIVPPMMQVEEEWLDNVAALSGAGQAKRSEIIKAARQSGLLVVNSRDPEDPNSQADISKGIIFRDAMIPEFERLSNLIAMEMQRFERIAGFNEANNGGTIDERQAVRNVNLMSQSQAKALKPITDSMDWLEADIAEIVYGQLQNALKAGQEMEWLSPALGDGTARVIQLTADTIPGSVGIEMRQAQDQVEADKFMEMLSSAVTNGEITAADVYYLRGIEDYVEASEMLRKRSEARARQKQQDQLAIVQEDGKKVQASAEMQMQIMQAKAQMDRQSRLEEAQVKAQLAMDAQERKHQQDMEKLQAQMAMEMAKLGADIDSKFEMLIRTLESSERNVDAQERTKVEVAEGKNRTAIEVAEERVESRGATSRK